jgi:hypothetical protein
MANKMSLARRENASRQPKMISVADALARYGIGRTKLYSLIGSGSIRAVKLGVKTLIDVEIADRFFDGLPSLSEAGDWSV